MYSRTDILSWMLGAFHIKSKKGNELKFDCPYCGHESCYFNVSKQAGFCHRAACQTVLTVDKLIDLIGYPPDLAGYLPEKEEAPLPELKLPEGAVPILENHEAVEALYLRGVTWENIKKFSMMQTKTHLIVPIYENSKLVQYNSRRVNKNVPTYNWFKALPPGVRRYKYASGYPITHYFLGWDECRLWDRLVLVENTFVSLWLRDLKCTTNFGSYLSPVHLDKLVHSNVKHVTFLWDEGANAQKAQKDLKNVGINSKVLSIKGQPDDYTKNQIKEMLNENLTYT